MNRTRVKICGITSPRDADYAVSAGADAIGLVFHEASPRNVSIEQAREICRHVPAFVSIVALTVNKPAAEVEALLHHLPIELLQFHGDESPEHCARFSRPFIKVLRVREELDIEKEIGRYGTARSILLDTYRAGVPGGTGESFDWELIPLHHRPSIVLAGGLTPANIADAVERISPFAVDVSGGVESAPGVKDRQKIQAFIAHVAQADKYVNTHRL